MNKNKKSINDLINDYDLKIGSVEDEIKSSKAKSVLLQFPDGLKPWATTITDYFQEKFPEVNFFIWMESCFGACDLPVLSKDVEDKFDLLIQFGHSPWHK